MDYVPISDRVEFAMTQIGGRLSYGSQPMHVMLQGFIDEALDDWSTDADDREDLKALIARRITVPTKYTGPLVVRLPEHHEPVAPPPDWPQTW